MSVEPETDPTVIEIATPHGPARGHLQCQDEPRGALWGLALVWVAGVVALELPRNPTVRREVRDSQVLQRLNELAPPGDVLRL